MSKIVTWSIVNNEIDFIKDILDFHLEWVDGMYFLDTGSTDGTLEILKEYSAKNSRVIVEEYYIKYATQYDKEWHEMNDPFPEVTIRNIAIERATLCLTPDWLVQLDGDEVFLPTTRNIIDSNPNAVCIGHSTINPVCKLEEHPMEIRKDCIVYDPHVRLWKPNHDIMYIENPSFKGHQYHCIPVYHDIHLFHHLMVEFTSETFHFHLHWMYGRKVESFYNRKNIFDKKIIANEQTIHSYSDKLPELFWKRRQEWLER